MKKFLVLYHATNAARDTMASEQIPEARARIAAWKSWAQQNTDLIVDFGMPLGMGKIMTKDAVMEGNSSVSEYSIVQGESLEAVIARLEGHPHFHTPGEVTIEVLEFLDRPGI